MNGLLWVNLIAFLAVTAYAISLFVYVVKTRIAFIKLGKKVEFDNKCQRTNAKNLGQCFWPEEVIKG